jgi:hypothetical protein
LCRAVEDLNMILREYLDRPWQKAVGNLKKRIETPHK